MGINQFRAYALQTLCEAHLWSYGEQDVFTLNGWVYCIRLEDDGRYSLTIGDFEPAYFPDMPRLFHHIFQSRMISYN